MHYRRTTISMSLRLKASPALGGGGAHTSWRRNENEFRSDGIRCCWDREEGYRRSFTALKRGGLLCTYGYSAGVQAQRRMLTILMWIARLFSGGGCLAASVPLLLDQRDAGATSRLVPGGSGVALRPAGNSRHPAARCRADSSMRVAEAHRRLEAGGLEGKLVLCPDLPSRRDRVPPQREPGPASQSDT